MQGHPNAFVYIALIVFVPGTFAAIWFLGPLKGVIRSLLAGWLFLPWIDNRWELIPMYDLVHLRTKVTYVCAVVLVASLLLDRPRWRRLRFHPVDLVMAGFCTVGLAAALANDLGTNEALSVALADSLTWGAPYLLGRVYLGDPGSVRELARSMAVAGVIYAPLCIFEIRMYPELHHIAYGYYQHLVSQTIRYGMFGMFRPMVFMHHPLQVALFMSACSVLACWTWRTGAIRQIAGVPMGWYCAVLVGTTVLCKTVGAIVLMGIGLLVLEATHRFRSRGFVIALILVPSAYCAMRIHGWSGQDLVAYASRATNADRAQSLGFRIQNEDMLIAKALQHPVLGWGRSGGGFRVYDENGRDVSVTDGLWVITLGVTGLVGLLALGLWVALPSWLFLRALPARAWRDPRIAAVAACAVLVLLGGVDDLLNDVAHVVFPAMAGGLVSVVVWLRRTRARARAMALARTIPDGAQPGPAAAPAAVAVARNLR